MTEHAVVIAGGGPTGLMLAGEVALAGVDVAVVERRAGQDAFEVVLPQPERVGVPGGKAADVQGRPGKGCDLRRLPLREEAIGDSTLIENFDGA